MSIGVVAPQAPTDHHSMVMPTTMYQVDAGSPPISTLSAPQNEPPVFNLHPTVVGKETLEKPWEGARLGV